MTKNVPAQKSAKGESREKAKREPGPPLGRTVRETIESVVIAFVLAFVFRTFEAEAFVIPTGSMAPTLQGRHKDVECPKCGYAYRGGASEEVDSKTGANKGEDYEVVSCTCPMCGYVLHVDAKETDHYSFNGDRILVGKGIYEFSEPRRWDVFVFKFPGEAKVNYIKRLVGLPNETIRILGGDVFAARDGKPFEILRKPPSKLEAMLQIVYDTDYAVDEMTDRGWPLRWQQWTSRDDGWTTPDKGRSYQMAGKGSEPAWLRYQHFVPTERDWDMLQRGPLTENQLPRPELITDRYAYNDVRVRGPKVWGEGPRRDRDRDGRSRRDMHWVGDLCLECQLETQSEKGTILLDLVKAGRHHGCAFDLATGKATLSIGGLNDYRPSASTSVRGPGKHQVKFANVDRQLQLWVDGSLVAFDEQDNKVTQFAGLGPQHPQSTAADPGDLAPAGIGSVGASLTVRHVKLWRDVYYIAASTRDHADQLPIQENDSLAAKSRHSEVLQQFLSSPDQWNLENEPGRTVFDLSRSAMFTMGPNQFFALGDNSPASADSRLWQGGPDAHVVDRDLLIGKALYIYWPHAWPTGYNFVTYPFGVEMRVPFYPNFKRMRLIR